MDAIDDLLLVMIVFLMAGSIWTLHICSVFLNILSSSEVKVWESLGSPKNIFSGASSSLLLNYITSASYKSIADSEVVTKGNLARVSLFVHGGVFVSFVFLMVLKAIFKDGAGY